MSIKKLILILVLTGFCLYFLSLFNEFVWDDEEQVVNNTVIQSISDIPYLFLGSTFNTGGTGSLTGVYYKPLMSVCFSLIYAIFKLNPFFYHLFQVSLHIFNSVLVFLVASRLFIKYLNNNNKYFKYFSCVFALIFLIHPINVEAVVYVSALQDVLFLFFGMLSLFVILYKNEIKRIELFKNINFLLISTFLIFLSLLSKETGVLFIVINFFYIVLFEKKYIKKYIFYLTVMFGLYLFLRLVIAGIRFSKNNVVPIMNAPLEERLITLPKILFFYIKTFFYPKYLFISQHWIVSQVTFNDFYIPLMLVSLFFSILFLYCYILWKKKRKELKLFFFFLIWFLVGISLHMQIFPLDMTVAERWFYFPIIGLLGMILCILIRNLNFRNKKIRSLNLIFLLSISSILFYRSLMRSIDWGNGFSLFNNDQKLNSRAFDLENNLGVEYFRKGNFEEAKIHFRKSTELASNWWTNWNNLGVISQREGDLEQAENFYLESIKNGNYYLSYENYLGVLIVQEKYNEAQDFLENDALLLFPYNQKLKQMYYYLENEEYLEN